MAKKQVKKTNQSKGGEERARRLSPAERSQIAREAAAARWEKEGKAKTLHATHEGVLEIGDLTIPCAVLEDKTRVLTETGMVKALGLYRSGAVLTRSIDASGSRLPLFVANKNIVPFVEPELVDELMSPAWFFPVGGGTRNRGVDAKLIPKICNVWLKARDAGVLSGNQRQEIVAIKADILMRGLATTGIVALVDEATGFQDDRDRDALAKILEKFVADELQPWMRTFPPDFYRNLCRLRGVDYPPKAKNFPRYFGTLTNNIIYDRLAPGIKRELQGRNPSNDKGQRTHRHHQYLTRDLGHPKLIQHIGLVLGLMKVSPDTDWDGFKSLLDRAAPVYPKNPTLFDEDDPDND